MTIDKYLTALDGKVRSLQGVVASWSIQREIDANLGVGFISGRIEFVDGSRLEFSEQLPTEHHRYRLHYMDAQGDVVVRWDSAPHHKGLNTFPFHKHTPLGVEKCPAITFLN